MTPRLRLFLSYALPPVALLAIVVGLWHLAVVWTKVPPLIVPGPHAVLQSLIRNRTELFRATMLTGGGALVGFCASLVVGVLTACVFSQSVLIQRAAYPYALFLQTVPIVAIAPLIILWFGNGFASVAIIAFIVSLFPIVTNTTTGLTELDRNMEELFAVNNASRMQRLVKLQLPNSIPYLVTGARISSGLSVIGAIVGEFFSGFGGGKFGLGYLIYFTSGMGKTDYLFASIVASTILGLIIFASITLVGDRVLLRWRR